MFLKVVFFPSIILSILVKNDLICLVSILIFFDKTVFWVVKDIT